MSLISLLNQAIATDLNARELLVRLNEKTVSLHITTPILFHRTFLFSNQSIDFITTEKPDAVICGPLSAFISFGLRKDPQAATQKGLSFEGDPHLLKIFQQLARTLNVDWQEVGSLYLGDLPTHYISSVLNKMKQQTKTRSQHTAQELVDYFTEESQKLVPKPKIDKMLADIDILRSQIDRLELYIDELLEKQRVL